MTLYSRSMNMLAGPLLLLALFTLMEGVAYAAHRWIMHGPGWFLHASHHRTRTGLFEANDFYALLFALPSILLFWWGIGLGHGALWAWAGGGIAAYGAVYFAFHDVLVHRRIRHRFVPRWSYAKRLVQAHRIHHAVETRKGAVSFGFLYAPRIAALRAQLRAQGGAARRQSRL